MKRDMDLLRQILVLVEDQPAGEMTGDFSSLGTDEKVIAEHVWLAQQAGLLDAIFPGGTPSNGVAAVRRLTPAGHDFLAQARQPVLWGKAKDIAAKQGVGLTVEVMKALLSHLALKALGLSNEG